MFFLTTLAPPAVKKIKKIKKNWILQKKAMFGDPLAAAFMSIMQQLNTNALWYQKLESPSKSSIEDMPGI